MTNSVRRELVGRLDRDTRTHSGGVRGVFPRGTALQQYSRAISPVADGTSRLCVRDKEALGLLAGLRCRSSRHLSAFLLPGGLRASASRKTLTPRVLQRLRARGILTISGALPDRPLDAPSLRLPLLRPDGRRAGCRPPLPYSCSRPSSVRACTPGHAIGTRTTGATRRTALSDFLATSLRSFGRSRKPLRPSSRGALGSTDAA